MSKKKTTNFKESAINKKMGMFERAINALEKYLKGGSTKDLTDCMESNYDEEFMNRDKRCKKSRII